MHTTDTYNEQQAAEEIIEKARVTGMHSCIFSIKLIVRIFCYIFAAPYSTGHFQW